MPLTPEELKERIKKASYEDGATVMEVEHCVALLSDLCDAFAEPSIYQCMKHYPEEGCNCLIQELANKFKKSLI